jgi:hypothetical protein
MEGKNVLQGMIKFNHTLFDNAFDLSVQFQDQAEKLGETILDKTGITSTEYRKPYETMMSAYKTSRDSFKKFVDEGFQNAETALK